MTFSANRAARRALLVAGGPLSPAQARLLQEEIAGLTAQIAQTALIGVDGGAAHLLHLGIIPHYATGDFDSLSLEAREELAAQGTQIIPTPDQNFTDLDKALFFARSLGVQSAEIWAATGGRIDHAYSVLSAVLKHERETGDVPGNAPMQICLRDEWGQTRPVPAGGLTLTHQKPGRILSLITLGAVTGITTTGVEWPLTHETLAPGVRDGTLNRITSETVTVSYQSGDLLLFVGN